MNPKIVKIEKILGTTPDGVWGKDDQGALNKLKSGSSKSNQSPPPTQPGVVRPEMQPMDQQTYT
jgi:hypothetical protein